MQRLQEELDRRSLTPEDTVYNVRPFHTYMGDSGASFPHLGSFLVPL